MHSVAVRVDANVLLFVPGGVGVDLVVFTSGFLSSFIENLDEEPLRLPMPDEFSGDWENTSETEEPTDILERVNPENGE